MCLMMKFRAIKSDQKNPKGWPKNSWKNINKIQKLFNNQQLPKGWRKSWLSLSESLRGELLLQVLEDTLYSKVYSHFLHWKLQHTTLRLIFSSHQYIKNIINWIQIGSWIFLRHRHQYITNIESWIKRMLWIFLISQAQTEYFYNILNITQAHTECFYNILNISEHRENILEYSEYFSGTSSCSRQLGWWSD